ncbi:MAG: MMPL family transporter [Bacteroidales bacterium]
MTQFIIKYRWFIIISCLLIGISFACLIPSSKTDPEIRNYIPSGLRSRIETDKIEKEFGVQDIIMLLFQDSSIVTTGNLKQIKEIDRDISGLSGVTNRISPFTVKKITSSEGMMKVDPMIKRIPSDSSGISALKKEIENNRYARDIVISSDMSAAAITANINDQINESSTLHKIDSLIAAHPGNVKVLKGGLPYIRQHIMKDVRKDTVVLVPLALLIMLLVLKLALGEWKSVMMPFAVVLLSTGICMGLIPLLGWKMSIITLLVPVILIAVANNYGIYLVARFQEISLRDKNSSRDKILRELTGSLNMPILFSGLTTIAGILGLLTHSIIPARQVGILAATGVTAALLMSLTLIPALIFIRKKEYTAGKNGDTHSGIFSRLINFLSRIITSHPGRVIIISSILTLIVSSGIFLLRTETNQENYFPKNNPVKQASGLINRKFGGSQTISVMITGNIKNPAIMNGIDNLTRQVEKMKGVGEVFSISQAVREMSKAIYVPGEEGYDRIPATAEGIAQMFELYYMSGDPADFRQLMNPENSRAHILIRLSDPENGVITDLRNRISELAVKIPAETVVGGYAIIMADFARSIIKGQISSLLFALIIVGILLTIIFRSFKGGLIGLIPLAASIMILFGFMGYAGIALDSATALLSSIMIGVGVDFTIQYIWCFNIHIRKGLSYVEATRDSLGTIGRSILINAFSVMAGFSALIFSGFTSIRFFGYLVIISIGSCLIGAIVVIPAIIIWFRPGFVENDMSKSKKRKHEKRNDNVDIPVAAFAGLSTARGRGTDYE